MAPGEPVARERGQGSTRRELEEGVRKRTGPKAGRQGGTRAEREQEREHEQERRRSSVVEVIVDEVGPSHHQRKGLKRTGRQSRGDNADERLTEHTHTHTHTHLHTHMHTLLYVTTTTTPGENERCERAHPPPTRACGTLRGTPRRAAALRAPDGVLAQASPAPRKPAAHHPPWQRAARRAAAVSRSRRHRARRRRTRPARRAVTAACRSGRHSR